MMSRNYSPNAPCGLLKGRQSVHADRADNVTWNSRPCQLQKKEKDAQRPKHTKWYGTPRGCRVSLALEHVSRLSRGAFLDYGITGFLFSAPLGNMSFGHFCGFFWLHWAPGIFIR